ncbi:MAG: hypothetical protein KDE20_20885, partial [Caldilineaceae bacterium]|nr:hypothetical protein [Caldilineaceae bacterium]
TVFFSSISSTNPIGGGLLMLVDSTSYTTVDHGFILESGMSAKVWSRTEIQKDVQMWGVWPGNESVEYNTIGMQNALNGGNKKLYFNLIGEYDFWFRLYVYSNTSLIGTEGVIWNKVDYTGAPRNDFDVTLATAYLEQMENDFVLVNQGAYSRTINENILIENIRIKTNGIYGTQTKRNSLYGLRGEFAFWGVKNLTIRNVRILDIGPIVYAVHIADFDNVLIDNCRFEGDKNAIVANKGTGLTIKNCKTKTYEDAINLSAAGYQTGTPERGSVSNVVIDGFVDVYHDTSTAGNTIRMFPGAWPAWSAGNYISGDVVLSSNNNLYELSEAGSSVWASTVEPSHTLEDDSLWYQYADGLHWRWIQADSIRYGSITNVSISNAIFNRQRPAITSFVQVDTSNHLRTIFPGETIPLVQFFLDNVSDIAPVGGWDTGTGHGDVYYAGGGMDLLLGANTTGNIRGLQSNNRVIMAAVSSPNTDQYGDVYNFKADLTFDGVRIPDTLVQSYDFVNSYNNGVYRFTNTQQIRNAVFEVTDNTKDTTRVTGDISITTVQELIPADGDRVMVDFQPIQYIKGEWRTVEQKPYFNAQFLFNAKESTALDAYFEGTTDSTITVDWGDAAGNDTTLTLAGSTDRDWNHTYSVTDTFGSRIIIVGGDLNAVTKVDAASSGTAFYGDSKTLLRFPNVTNVNVGGTSFGGDIKHYADLSGLTSLRVQQTLTRGNIADLQGLPLTAIYAYNCPRLFGRFDSLNTMSSMDYFLLKESPMEGNLNVVTTFPTDVINVQLYSMDVDSSKVYYTTASWPAFNGGNFDFRDNYLTAS